MNHPVNKVKQRAATPGAKLAKILKIYENAGVVTFSGISSGTPSRRVAAQTDTAAPHRTWVAKHAQTATITRNSK